MVGKRIVSKARALGPAAPGVVDVVVVGAGPAGLSAALTALEHGLRSVVLEQEKNLGGTVLHYPRRKLVLVQAVELPPPPEPLAATASETNGAINLTYPVKFRRRCSWFTVHRSCTPSSSMSANGRSRSVGFVVGGEDRSVFIHTEG